MDQKNNKQKKRSWAKRIIKFLVYTFLSLLILLLVAVLGVNWYLQSHKTKLIDQLGGLHGGALSFSSAEISWWESFPQVSITIDSILLHDSLYVEHQKPLLALGRLRADLSLEKVLQDSLELEGIHLENGEINLFTNEDGYNNVRSIFPDHPDKPRQNREKGMQLLTNGLSLSIADLKFSYTDAIKYKRMVVTIDDLNSQLKQEQEDWLIDVIFDMAVDELAVNTRKGGYLQNSRLKGAYSLSIQEAWIDIPLHKLEINEQSFEIGAKISRDGQALTKLWINNPVTHFANSARLLTPAIQEKLHGYHIQDLFATKTEIEGSFGPGEDPVVSIDFQMQGNEVTAKDFSFTDVHINGYFVNRHFDDERRQQEKRGNIRLELADLQTQFGPFQLKSSLAKIYAGPTDTRLQTNLEVQGRASAISHWLNHEQFLFKRGRFLLNAKVDGSLDRVNEMLIASYAELNLVDFDVIYRPVDALFPFDRLYLQKKAGDANFEIISSHLNAQHDYTLDGLVRNLPALLIDLATEQASSEVELVAQKITWADFLNYFGDNGYFHKTGRKTASDQKKTLKETLSGLHHNFQPRIKANVDTLEYYDRIRLTNFLTGLHFEDEHTLILEETQFHYANGLVDFSAKLDISDPHQTPFILNFRTEHLDLSQLLPAVNYFNIKLLANLDSLPTDLNVSIQHQGIINDSVGLIRKFNKGEIVFNDGHTGKLRGRLTYEPSGEDLSTKISLVGDPELLNNFYDSEDFFFYGGHFDVNFDYEGDMRDVNQLVQEAEVDLTIKNSEVFYRPVEVYFPIKELVVMAHRDHADFNILLQSDSLQKELNLKGKFENLHGFLLDDLSQPFEVDVEAYSPKFNWRDLAELIQPGDQEAINRDKLYTLQSCKGLLNTFHPKLSVRFDTFIYSDRLLLEEVYTGIHLQDSSTLFLNQTGFTFHEGSLEMDAKLDLSNTGQFPFQVNLAMENLDIGSLMRALDHFSIADLRETKKLEGRLSMQMAFSSIYDLYSQSLIKDANQAEIHFDLHDLELVGLRSIDAIAKKIHKERRFADLLFAPINGQININGPNLQIPLMEVQSNALQLFVQGDYTSADDYNIWISIPVKNLKKPKLDQIPAKTGYALAGGKVFLELTLKEDGRAASFFHLRNRKFYKQRGILPQFKIDRKKYRAIRKAAKKEKSIQNR